MKPPLPESPATTTQPRPNWLKNLGALACLLAAVGWLTRSIWATAGISNDRDTAVTPIGHSDNPAVDRAFATAWKEAGQIPAPRASDLTIARRMSIALTGAIPSLEEMRAFEAQPESTRLAWWLDALLTSRRHADYFAERFARAYVGVETGPFLVYRRRRMIDWLSDQIRNNRPYDTLVRDLITAEGIWTSRPAANFVTVTIDQNEKKGGPDEVKLAARTARAFLGVRIDCMQCHDDKFGDRWKQVDFHQLASFFSGAEMQLTGVREKKNASYEVRFRGERAPRPVPAMVPFQADLLPENGSPRERLAVWTTHPENRAFARATVNRVWALMFNKPLVDPIDDIPLEGPYPPGVEELAEDFTAHGFDLRRLIRLVAASAPFQLDSRSPSPDNPATSEQEAAWTVFPITRLRPDQVAASLIQSSSLTTIDHHAHIIQRATRFGQLNDFVKRYGDLGEDEFIDQGGTIPQRLLMMNGNLLKERTKENVVMNASTRIAALTSDEVTAVETAYLTTLTRRPSPAEADHFTARLQGKKGKSRIREMEDLYWALLNSTEFSWNH